MRNNKFKGNRKVKPTKKLPKGKKRIKNKVVSAQKNKSRKSLKDGKHKSSKKLLKAPIDPSMDINKQYKKVFGDGIKSS